MSRRRRSRIVFEPSSACNGWDRFLAATLRHSTLPWCIGERTIAATSFDDLDLARRDALSVFGQIAAHYALLRQAGIADELFDGSEWIVSFARGEDCRAIRIGRRIADGPASKIASVLEPVAEALEIDGVEALRLPWVKPELVYADVDRQLDVAADMRWFRAAAWGEVLAPGPAVLQEFVERRERRIALDHTSAASLFLTASGSSPGVDAFTIGESASPLAPFSAFSTLRMRFPEGWSSVGAAAEQLIAASESAPFLFCVSDTERFDMESRALLELLLGHARAGWILSPQLAAEIDDVELHRTKFIAISRRVASLENLRQELACCPVEEAGEWLARWTSSSSYREFLQRGTAAHPVGPGQLGVMEPKRSYLGALALLGSRIAVERAGEFLLKIGCQMTPLELAVEPAASLVEGSFQFVSEEVRARFQEMIPRASAPGLARIAIPFVDDRRRRADLHLESRMTQDALSDLESIDWRALTSIEVLKALEPFGSLLRDSPILSEVMARAYIACGRYSDALEIASHAPAAIRPFLQAWIARRRGRYDEALRLLGDDRDESIECRFLRTEILRLSGRLREARSVIASVDSTDPDAVSRKSFESALIDIDEGAPLSSPNDPSTSREWRLSGYRALSASDWPKAKNCFATALSMAAALTEEIDSRLDLVYTHFVSGDWQSSRHAAVEALGACEESEGDRAAGGVLFTLGYLEADAGRWASAADRIRRIDRFYRETSDNRRLEEIEVVRAHLALCRLELDDAGRFASGVLASKMTGDLREAAAIIADEVDWIANRSNPLRSTPGATCAVLRQRHFALRSRRDGKPSPDLTDPFLRSLIEAELRTLEGKGWGPPLPSVASEELQLIRSAVGLASRGIDVGPGRVRELAEKHRIVWPERVGVAPRRILPEELLQEIAIRSVPFGDTQIAGAHWRLASRNRLGNWIEEGSLPPLGESVLDGQAASWLDCGAGIRLWIEGLGELPAATQRAVGALVRIRVEHNRLDRLAQQDALASEPARSVAVRGVVASSEVMRQLLDKVTRVAQRDVPVCIRGESGTGKELIARAIHAGSPRKSRPFVPINCAALPEHLIESELFGHARGAFTGADRDRAGLIESSDGGTLFLDEIGELPLPAQAKLLRFLQEGEFRRVGDVLQKTADVRIVAATNRKLEEAVDAGSFREDLYYRIEGVQLMVPALRERGSDVILLARHFLIGEREKHRCGPDSFDSDAELLLGCYPWPGNVRELQNTIRSAHALAADARRIGADHLPDRISARKSSGTLLGGYHDELFRFRRSLVERSLEQAEGNQSRAARVLGISRQALAYQIKELGILVSDR